MSEPSISGVIDNSDAQRFEVTEDGKTAVADYIRDGDTITFTHTIVPPALEGRGLGSRLVKAALDDARAKGARVVPQCSFVAAYIDRHPKYCDLVA